jgi:hypothetical protein
MDENKFLSERFNLTKDSFFFSFFLIVQEGWKGQLVND